MFKQGPFEVLLNNIEKDKAKDKIVSIQKELFSSLLSQLDGETVDKSLLLLQTKLKSSFYEFFKHFWDVVVQEPLIDNWHIKFICEEIQKVIERVFRREAKEYDLIINIPPGSTKSTIVSVMLPAWAWTRDPSLRFITGSYSSDLSMEHSVATRDLIQSDKYNRLFPFVKLSKDQNTKTNYKLTVGGQRFSTSTGGTVTGVHAHVIIVDDPLNPKQAASDAELKNANHWITETLSTRKTDKELTPTILIMQRLAEDDCTGYLLSKESEKYKIRHICLPCDDSWPILPRKCAKHYAENDGLLDKNRLPRRVIDAYKDVLGSMAFAGQFGQQPVPLEGGFIKKEWLRFYDLDNMPHFERIIQSWDTAFKKESYNDFSVGTTWGETIDKKYYLLDVFRGKFEFPELEKHIKKYALKHNPIAILIEDKASGQSLIQTLRDRTSLPIIGIKVSSDKSKIVRASIVSPIFEAGKVYLPKDAEWMSSYVSELLKFPNSKYDDQVDSTTQALQWLQNASISIGRDLS